MAQPTPEWLNETFLAKCVQGEHENEKPITITQFKAVPAVPAGNNFTSNVVRVTLDFKEGTEDETHPLSLIVKYPLENVAQAEVFNDFTKVEFSFYYEFMPQASKLSADFFAPKSYFSKVPEVVVLEDLKVQGYGMADRIAQLDFDHCQLFVAASATFHAVSVAVHKVDPKLVETLGIEKTLRHDDEKLYNFTKMVMEEGCECVSDYMETSLKFKKYASLLRRASPLLTDKVIEAHKPSKILNCLTQGDPWTTNMMFKYDKSGKVCEIKLIDFQALRYASPVNDLLFFFWTSATNDVRDNNRDELFRSYLNALNNKLKELNCSEQLSYDELMKNVELLSPLSVMLVVGYLPNMLNPGVMDLDDMIESSQDKSAKKVNKAAKKFTQDYCEKNLSRHLKQLETMGVFKYLENMLIGT